MLLVFQNKNLTERLDKTASINHLGYIDLSQKNYTVTVSFS